MRLVLSRTNDKARSGVYSVALARKGKPVTCSDGNSFPVISNAVRGFLDVAAVQDHFVRLEGWAADVEASELPELIIVFSEGSSTYSNWNNWDRSGRCRTLQEPGIKGLRDSSFPLPLDAFEGKTVRVFGLSKEG